MLTDTFKELAAAKSKVAELEASVAGEIRNELQALPGRYGFADVGAFIAAVKAASGKRRGRKPGTGKAAVVTGKRRKRAKITDEIRAEVKKLVNDGMSGAEIAKAVSISLPSVQNIKKALGLVKKKK